MVFYQLLDYVSAGRNGPILFTVSLLNKTNNEFRDGLEPGQATCIEYNTVKGRSASLSQVDKLFLMPVRLCLIRIR